MRKLYSITKPLNNKHLKQGRQYEVNAFVPRNKCTIIRGTVYDDTLPCPRPVVNAPVVLIEKIKGAYCIISETLTDADGFYMFVIPRVKEHATYSIKTTTYDRI